MINLETYFTVIARCGFSVEKDEEKGIVEQKVEHEDFELRLNIEDAENFLFKFTPTKFETSGGYIIEFIYILDQFKAIFIIHGGKTYIVMNHEQLLRDIHEGYMKLTSMTRFTSMLDFDLHAEIKECMENLGYTRRNVDIKVE